VYNPGEKILVVGDTADLSTIREFEVVADRAEYVTCKGEGMIFHAAYCFPKRVEPTLRAVVGARQELRRLYEDSIKEVYELRNAISRGEL